MTPAPGQRRAIRHNGTTRFVELASVTPVNYGGDSYLATTTEGETILYACPMTEQAEELRRAA